MNTGTHAVIKAEYSDYRRVKGRKVIQIICEVPLDYAPHVHERLGEPGVGENQIWVAIARLDSGKTAKETPQTDKPAPEKRPRKRLMSERLYLACQQPAFREYLGGPGVITSTKEADKLLKVQLGITSKTECDVDGVKAEAAELLLNDYELTRDYSGTPAYEREQSRAHELTETDNV